MASSFDLQKEEPDLLMAHLNTYGKGMVHITRDNPLNGNRVDGGKDAAMFARHELNETLVTYHYADKAKVGCQVFSLRALAILFICEYAWRGINNILAFSTSLV